MSFTYEEFLGQALPSDDDEDHGEELRQNFKALGRVSAPDNFYYVSPAYTEGELFCSEATDRRHFDTIQAAITAAAGSGYSELATINVAPGIYPEKLSITGSVAIRNAGCRPLWFGQGAGQSVKITGDGTKTPVITWTPTEATPCALILDGLCVDNSYADADSSIATTAYAIRVNAQTALGSGSNRLVLNECSMRMQTWGDDNKWTYGLWLNGWIDTVIRDSHLAAFGYAGGNNNGGVLRTVQVSGTNNAAYISRVFIERSMLYNQCLISTLTPTQIYLDRWATVKVHRSDFYNNFSGASALWLNGGTGTNAAYGLDGAEFAAYLNTTGGLYAVPI